jgi:Spx/MgsR family transcriptional regulator
MAFMAYNRRLYSGALTMITLYGIPNCDTIKKARAWLDKHHIDYQFHDYKKDGITKTRLDAWCIELDFEVLVNQRGTTWRKLPDSAKEKLTKAKAINLMMENPSLIKRPILDTGKIRIVGFDEKQYQPLLK